MDFRMANVTQEDYTVFMALHRSFRYAEFCKGEEIPRSKPVINTYEVYSEYAGNEWIYFSIEDGTETGYVIITPYEDGSVKLQEIYIADGCQRRGSGTMLVSFVKKFLKNEGFSRIELLSYNAATDRFWSQCGFTPINGSEQFEFILK